MNLYRKKRLKANLSEYTMAKEMGLSLKQYRTIEEGKVNLKKDWLDKFNEVISNAKEINFNRKQKLHDIRLAIKDNELKKAMMEQGYNQSTLGRKMGYHPSVICNVMRLNGKINDDRLEEVYDFLMNPTNKNVNKDIEDKTTQKEAREIEIEESTEKEIPEEPKEEVIIQPIVYEKTEDQSQDKDKKIKQLEKQIEIITMQLIRYEKLIDRM